MVKFSGRQIKKNEVVLQPKGSENRSPLKRKETSINTSRISLMPAGKFVPRIGKPQTLINPPSQQQETGQAIVRPAIGFRVRVSNIAYDVKEADILASFSLIGKILACSLKDGTAIVTYDKRQDAAAAIEKYHQGDIRGRKLYLDFD